jgi:hypothetical protein
MKLLKNVIFLFVAFAFIITSSCKKYPDGPLISFQTKVKRIVGIWDVEYFEINGYDSTSYLKNKPFYGMYRLDKDGETGQGHYLQYLPEEEKYFDNGTWDLRNKKNDLAIYLATNLFPESTLGPYRAQFAVWEIRKLTETQLWLKTTYTDGREYLIKFKLFKDL